MLLRKRLVVGIASLVLAALAAGGAFLARPVARARYHLYRVTPADVSFVTTDRRWMESDKLLLGGHALAFAESAAAKELLPELLALAHDENDRDDRTCLRELLIFVSLNASPRGSTNAHWRWGAPPPKDEPSQWPAVDPSVLSELVRCLGSHDESLRRAAIMRLPLDGRAVSAVVTGWRRALSIRAAGDPREHTEPYMRWLHDYALEHQGGVSLNTADDARPEPDDPWSWLLFINGEFTPMIVSATPSVMPTPPADAELLTRLDAWVARNGSTLPEQLPLH